MNRIRAEVQGSSPVVWVHCSSVGEFEQARPIIEWYKREKPEYKILLTFFSPSGYELRKKYEYADWVYYLPMDTPKNARAFIEYVKPVKALFIKYEFWYNYLHELKRNKIETYIVAAIFRPSQPFFQRTGAFFRKMLECYTLFFVQDQQSADLLNKVGYSKNVVISGDTRFDRVYQITQSSRPFPIIERFVANHFTLVAGSTWEPDEEIIAFTMKNFPNAKLVIAPHETGKERIAAIEERFSGFQILKFSSFDKELSNGSDSKHQILEKIQEQLERSNVLIIDCVGILSSIYRYGNFAYIGGGFGVGIHNILEAATYGCPVVFGPNYGKFKEATDLLRLGGAVSVKSATELHSVFDAYMNTQSALLQGGEICRNYVQSNLGATLKVVSMIEKNK